MRRLGERLYAETGFQWANVGAAVSEEGVLLVDCPVRPSDSLRWREGLRPLSPKGIRYLIATDYHGDHTTGAAFVGDVTFIAPQRVYEKIAGAGGKDPFSKQIFVETLKDQGHAEEAAEIEAAIVPPPQICFDETL
ncbi:MAG: MBL fold metallo-hydrolase, partial [bacterium]